MTTTRSLGPERSARVREAIAKYLKPKLGSQVAIAEALGIQPGALSQLLSGRSGASPELARRVARLAKLKVHEVIGDHSLDEPGPEGESEVEYEHVRSPTFGALPGWAEAEAEARERYSKVPPEAWEGARSMSGFSFPERGRVTPDFVRAAARAWEEMQERLEELARETPDKKAADRAEERRLEAMHDELEASKRRK